jgi:hypothetical protein
VQGASNRNLELLTHEASLTCVTNGCTNSNISEYIFKLATSSSYIQGFGPSLMQFVLYYNLYFDVMIHWGLGVGINCFPIAHMIWKNFLEIVHSI